MFKNLIHELERLNREKLAIPVSADEQGYVDRECPAKGCLFVFKVLEHDWKDRFRDEAVFCPLCRHSAPADQWWTTRQVREAQKQAKAVLRARINNAMHFDAREFNARAPRGFITISMKVASGDNSREMLVPIDAAAVLEQRLTCEQCGAGYAVAGSAFFCPCCGHNSVEKMFDGALAKVRTKLDGIAKLRDALRESLGADDAETFCRSIIEGGLQDCVVAFQHLAERLYVPWVGKKPPGQNVFQRVGEGSKLWKAAVGAGYEDWLTIPDLDELKVFFQQRHLFAHREGLVDEKYVLNSGDTRYLVGQRLVVAPSDVLRMVTLIAKLGNALRVAARTSSPQPSP
ncbi:MAG: hypothetical protein Q8Q09_18170 [Deltaproteobacteria bacterium]|nr:hypothetical protein [Deltaproteobacteria bacterium]